jgi:hypothetical protein
MFDPEIQSTQEDMCICVCTHMKHQRLCTEHYVTETVVSFRVANENKDLGPSVRETRPSGKKSDS